MIDDATGAVLAGGAGRRLGGVRKAFLRLDGEPLIARTLRLFGELFPDTLVVANEPAPYRGLGAPIVSDPIPGRGAPGGLLAALTGSERAFVFLAACDMPALNGDAIRALARRRIAGQPCVAVRDGRPEPLHAFWPRESIATLEMLLRSGNPSFRDLLDRLPHVKVPIEEIEREAEGSRDSFENVNTPEDLLRFGLARPSDEDEENRGPDERG